MEAKQQTIVIAVVALVVGAAIGIGVGSVMFSDDCNTDEEYSFYLYFAEDDKKNGWYSATASDASEAFDKAMKANDIEYNGASGYPSDIGGTVGYWYSAQYLYTSYDKTAEDASILYPTESYGVLSYSNGWKQISGYDDNDGLKLDQINTNVFFMSPYAADYSAESPVSVTSWMNSGPFA